MQNHDWLALVAFTADRWLDRCKNMDFEDFFSAKNNYENSAHAWAVSGRNYVNVFCDENPNFFKSRLPNCSKALLGFSQRVIILKDFSQLQRSNRLQLLKVLNFQTSNREYNISKVDHIPASYYWALQTYRGFWKVEQTCDSEHEGGCQHDGQTQAVEENLLEAAPASDDYLE